MEKFIAEDRENVNSKFQELGYNYVCLDLKGYRTGSLNILVAKVVKPHSLITNPSNIV